MKPRITATILSMHGKCVDPAVSSMLDSACQVNTTRNRSRSRQQETSGLIDRTELPDSEHLVQTEERQNLPVVSTARKPFVEPQVSSPVDVLEATTFFQAVGTGTIP